MTDHSFEAQNVKRDLKIWVAKDLKKAFENFESVINPSDELANELILLQGRYLDSDKMFNLNISDKSHIDIEISKIRKSLLSLIDKWEPITQPSSPIQLKDSSSFYDDSKGNFPWPELINLGMIHLFRVKEKLETQKPENIVEFSENYIERNQLKNHKEIQLSILNDKREFIFHNWKGKIGKQAYHEDISSGINIFNSVFSYPYGTVSWIDKDSNHAPHKTEILRENFILFATVNENKIVIELHNER